MSVESDIENALLARARTLTFSPALPVDWPNRKFDPPASGKYVRVRHFPNRPERVFLNGVDPHRRIGFLQISIVMPLHQGPDHSTVAAGVVTAHFPADLKLTANDTRVRVTSAPSVGPAFETDQSWITVVTIYYEVIA